MKNNESLLQRECVKWFRYQYPQYKMNFFAVPNSGKRNIITASIMKAEGQLAGVSDLILLIPKLYFHGLMIEMKCGYNKQSIPQQDFQREVEKHNYKYIVCYSFDEFQREINFYLQ